MRALTLKPHWAHAVAHLGKRIENRKQPIPPALVGQRVAIHAGATLPKDWQFQLDECDPEWMQALYDDGNWSTSRLTDADPDDPSHWIALRTRAIVATAVLRPFVRTVRDRVYPPPWAMDAAHWWWLADVVTLATPVPVQRGQLGLWRLDSETEARVRAAEAAARGGETC